MFAAIGTDGTREVVWGLGETVEDAMYDAEQEMHAGDCFSSGALADLHMDEVSAEQVSVIESGDVSWPVAVQGAGEEDDGGADATFAAEIEEVNRGTDEALRAVSATNETVTLAAREAYASVMRDSDSRDGYNASGDALDAAGAAIKTIVGDRTGYFDAETLTWTFDAEVQS